MKNSKIKILISCASAFLILGCATKNSPPDCPLVNGQENCAQPFSTYRTVDTIIPSLDGAQSDRIPNVSELAMYFMVATHDGIDQYSHSDKDFRTLIRPPSNLSPRSELDLPKIEAFYAGKFERYKKYFETNNRFKDDFRYNIIGAYNVTTREFDLKLGDGISLRSNNFNLNFNNWNSYTKLKVDDTNVAKEIIAARDNNRIDVRIYYTVLSAHTERPPKRNPIKYITINVDKILISDRLNTYHTLAEIKR